MRDKNLYATILGVEAPWVVNEVELRGSAEEVEVHLDYDAKAPLHCPTCGGDTSSLMAASRYLSVQDGADGRGPACELPFPWGPADQPAVGKALRYPSRIVGVRIVESRS